MEKFKSIFKPDLHAIVQNLYAWGIPIMVGAILSWWSKRGEWLPQFSSWTYQVNTPEIIKSIIGFVIPALGFGVVVRGFLFVVALPFQRQQLIKRKRLEEISKIYETVYTKKLDVEWAAVIYNVQSQWKDRFKYFAAIRIDNKIDCRHLSARLIRVTSLAKEEFSGKIETSNLDINKINPTGDDLQWNTEGNICLLQVVREYSEDRDAVFVFKNNRTSTSIKRGNYEIEIVISGNNIQETKVVKKMSIKEPHYIKKGYSGTTYQTGLEWL